MLLDKKNEAIPEKLVERVKKRHPSNKNFSSLRYRHFTQGNYSLVEIFSPKSGNVLGRGISKRNPIDRNNGEIGELVALTRAIEDHASI